MPNDQSLMLDETEMLKVEYEQACNWYHRIDDFRAKLLGFLPLISGTGIFLLFDKSISAGVDKNYMLAIGLFGFFVTLGLLFYELRGVQRCIRITNIAKDLEKLMNVAVPGPFLLQEHSLGGVVNEPVAGALIYSSVLAAWTYIAMHYFASGDARWIVTVGIFIGGLSSIYLVFYHRLRHDPNYLDDKGKLLQGKSDTAERTTKEPANVGATSDTDN